MRSHQFLVYSFLPAEKTESNLCILQQEVVSQRRASLIWKLPDWNTYKIHQESVTKMMEYVEHSYIISMQKMDISLKTEKEQTY